MTLFFRENDFPGNVFLGNVFPGMWLSGKRLIRETSFRESSFRESDFPGNVRKPSYLPKILALSFSCTRSETRRQKSVIMTDVITVDTSVCWNMGGVSDAVQSVVGRPKRWRRTSCMSATAAHASMRDQRSLSPSRRLYLACYTTSTDHVLQIIVVQSNTSRSSVETPDHDDDDGACQGRHWRRRRFGWRLALSWSTTSTYGSPPDVSRSFLTRSITWSTRSRPLPLNAVYCHTAVTWRTCSRWHGRGSR